MRQEVVPFNIKITCIQPGDTTTELHGKTKNPEVRPETKLFQIVNKRQTDANIVLIQRF